MVDGLQVKKILALIPVRLKSKRLKEKALLKIGNIPMFVHVYNRTKFSKLVTDVFVCCDSKKIINEGKKYNVNCIKTKKKHENGTERILEAYSKIKKNYHLVIDIQGDEPLIEPSHIDYIIKFHLKNPDADIVLPTLKIKRSKNENIVKCVKDKNKKILYLSRAEIPYEYKKKNNFLYKHLSIISFKPDALKRFGKKKKTNIEKIEGIELVRALEIGLKIKSPNLKGDSFSVDVMRDYRLAKKKIKNDKLFKIYKKKILIN